MEKVTLWVELCAVCAVVSAVLTGIVPESKLKSVYKTLCAFIMLFAFFSVFTSGKGFDADSYNYTDNSAVISEETDELLIVEGEKMMNRLIENKLYESKIEAECKAEMSLSDDTLKTDCIYLYGSFSDEDKENAKRIVCDYLKEECEVFFAKKDE